MVSVPLHPAPKSICPDCLLDPSRSNAHTEDGIGTANYLCPDGHMWTTRWLARTA